MPSADADGRPFAGRQDELRQFDAVLASSKRQAVVVVGQAGMGKTMLVNRMAKYAATNSLYADWAYHGLPDAMQFCSRHKRTQELYQGQRDQRVNLWRDVSRLRLALPETAMRPKLHALCPATGFMQVTYPAARHRHPRVTPMPGLPWGHREVDRGRGSDEEDASMGRGSIPACP